MTAHHLDELKLELVQNLHDKARVYQQTARALVTTIVEI